MHDKWQKISKQTTEIVDVAIVGAGLAGKTLALSLAQAGVRVALVERQRPETLAQQKADGRTTAIAAGPRATFERLGLWPDLERDAGAIWDIRVTDRASTLYLHFDHSAIGGEPMGHVLENCRLRRVLLDGIMCVGDNLACYWGTSLAGFAADRRAARLSLDDGRTIQAALTVGADGRGSALRRMAGIGVRASDYGQTAIVCTAYHDRPHGGIAHERFLKAGPFAILPMANAEDGSHRSSIVWTQQRALGEHLLAMSTLAFEAAHARAFGDFLGEVRVPGVRWGYPLSLTLVSRLTGPRLVLLGDAAHGIHPIAGQGFNVSVRDIEALSRVVTADLGQGQDPGGRTPLNAYARRRWPDILAMAAATDGLNRLFGSDLPPVALARRLGLAAVHRMSPLKRQFQRHAMGIAPLGQVGG